MVNIDLIFQIINFEFGNQWEDLLYKARIVSRLLWRLYSMNHQAILWNEQITEETYNSFLQLSFGNIEGNIKTKDEFCQAVVFILLKLTNMDLICN
jgi:hypothetical protein